MIDVAYLRAYRPAADVRLPVTAGALDVPRLGPAVLTTESQIADAWEVEWHGVLWRCPRTPRRRMLESVVAYHRATERFGVGMVTDEVATVARRELARIATGASAPVPCMIAPWCPPLRWFVAFSPDDVAEQGLLRAAANAARGRLDEVADTARRVGVPDAIVEELADLSGWIESTGGAMLELDYRSVGRNLGADLVTEDTVTEMRQATDCLASGDLDEAVAHYTRAAARWAALAAVAYSS